MPKYEALQPVYLPKLGENDKDDHKSYNDRVASAQDTINQDLQVIYDLLIQNINAYEALRQWIEEVLYY
jgi:hypothetical protein